MQSAQTLFRLANGVEEYSLENGLKILIKRIPTSSTVSVWVFYRVGSRNETLGTTGSSHWCEHMLFKGGGKLGKGDVFRLISNEGGRNNAFTDHDLTTYFETLPRDKLELGLFIESERMAHSAFEPSEVESERQVIISEREGAENYPVYQVREELFASAFHAHPYRWPVVGWKSDLKTMTRDDLFTHYARFYHPSNAILVLTGNIDPNDALSKVRKYFSAIPQRESPGQKILFEEPEQMGERTSAINKPGALDYLGVGFRIPRTTHKDIPSLIVLSAILGGWKGLIGYSGDRFVPRSNRLYRALVENKIASEVTINFPINLDPSLLHFIVTIMPNSTLEAARNALLSEFAKIADSPPEEDEIYVALNQIRSWHAYENDGTTSQALTLGIMEIIEKRFLADNLVEQCLKVSPDDVQVVAKRYLSEKNRTVCTFETKSESSTS
ncbi:MAG: pitrilysin family protein [archaeon]|nr:pitrilysin family protein [archaeon]